MKNIVNFIFKYKIGIIVGIVAGLSTLALFPFAVGYTVSCPDSFPCNQTIMMGIGLLYAIIIPFLLIGASLDPLLSLPRVDEAGVVTPSYLINIIPLAFSLFLLLSTWMLIGIVCEVQVRKLKFLKSQ